MILSVFDLIALVWPLHTEWASKIASDEAGCPITKELNHLCEQLWRLPYDRLSVEHCSA